MIFDKLFAAAPTGSTDPGRQMQVMVGNTVVGGVRVSEETALSLSTVFACVRVISETLMVLPWRVYSADGNARKIERDHPLARLLKRAPNPEMAPGIFRQAMTMQALLWGNAYAEIEWSNGGDPLALWPLESANTELKRENGQLIYVVSDPETGRDRRILPEDMIHIRGPSLNGHTGLSIVGLARESVGAGLAQQRFSSSFWTNGGLFTGLIKQEAPAPGKPGMKALGETGVRNLLDSFQKRFTGANAKYKIAYLEPGFDFKSVSMPLRDAEFIASRKFSVADVCRWFRVPPHKVQDLDRATFSNIEHQSREFVEDAILPWVKRWEDELDNKMFGDSTEFYTGMDLKALMRGDSQARANYYKTRFETGSISPDEIRGFEDENPIGGPEGSIRMVPSNFVSLERAYRDGHSSQETGNASN